MFDENDQANAATPPLEILTPRELAFSLKVPVGTVYYWVSRDEIPYLRVGRHLRFVLSAVLAHFKAKTEQSRITCPVVRAGLDNPTVRWSLKTKYGDSAGSNKRS